MFVRGGDPGSMYRVFMAFMSVSILQAIGAAGNGGSALWPVTATAPVRLPLRQALPSIRRRHGIYAVAGLLAIRSASVRFTVFLGRTTRSTRGAGSTCLAIRESGEAAQGVPPSVGCGYVPQSRAGGPERCMGGRVPVPSWLSPSIIAVALSTSGILWERKMKEPILGVVFDKDGTLFDFDATWSGWAERTLRDLAGNDDAEARALGELIGFDLGTGTYAPDSAAIAGTPEDIVRILSPGLPGLDPDDLRERLDASAARVSLVEAAPLGQVMAELVAMGLSLGVATNDAEAVARAHLSAAGVEGVFDFVAGYDSGFGAKPTPGMCLAFAAVTGIPPVNVLMVGDSATDMLAGRAAGMRTVAVLTGRALKSDLARLASAVLPNIGYLPDWIAEQG